MPQEIYSDDFYCPQCDKRMTHNGVIGIRGYLARRLDIPYFLCGDCRLCSYSKLLLRQTISRWKEGTAIRGASYNQIYQESKKMLEETLVYYIKTAGYRFVRRFKRK